MAFPETLRELRKSHGLTQKELASKTGISLAAIASYENGLRVPKAKALASLEMFFQVSGSHLLGGTTNEKADKQALDAFETLKNSTAFKRYMSDYHFLTFENQKHAHEALDTLCAHILEMASLNGKGQNKICPRFPDELDEVIKVLRKLNVEGRREYIKRGLELLEIGKYSQTSVSNPKPNHTQQMEYNISNSSLAVHEVSIPYDDDEEPQVKVIVYETPAAAGSGMYLNDHEAMKEIFFPESTVPIGTDLGIRIQGDSMEPKIKDGSIVFVRLTPLLYSGDIGIFIYDGHAFCKKLELDDKRKIVKLVSLNKKHKTIVINKHDCMMLNTIGEVLFK